MAKRERAKLTSRRKNPAFEKFFKEHASVDATGKITVRDCYAYLGFNMNWDGQLISMTYANAVWFLTHGEWPKTGYHIDHVDDDSLNNAPTNLQELTEVENHVKRRGRKIYRSYGRGKYGYGLGVLADKRDGRFYVSRNMSRGHGNGDLQGVKYSLGGFDTIEEAEQAVASHIEELKIKGLGYIPPLVKKKPKKSTVMLEARVPEMRRLRKSGMTFQQIADQMGIRMGAVYKRAKDVNVG